MAVRFRNRSTGAPDKAVQQEARATIADLSFSDLLYKLARSRSLQRHWAPQLNFDFSQQLLTNDLPIKKLFKLRLVLNETSKRLAPFFLQNLWRLPQALDEFYTIDDPRLVLSFVEHLHALDILGINNPF
jgi:hypothetical protein